MTEFGWRGLLQVLKIQRRFRALLQQRQAPGGVGSPGGGLRAANKPPEDEMDNAAVCLFCLTDNIFKVRAPSDAMRLEPMKPAAPVIR